MIDLHYGLTLSSAMFVNFSGAGNQETWQVSIRASQWCRIPWASFENLKTSPSKYCRTRRILPWAWTASASVQLLQKWNTSWSTARGRGDEEKTYMECPHAFGTSSCKILRVCLYFSFVPINLVTDSHYKPNTCFHKKDMTSELISGCNTWHLFFYGFSIWKAIFNSFSKINLLIA